MAEGRTELAAPPKGLTPELRERIAALCREHGAVLCYLFGSLAANARGRPDRFSDVDLAVLWPEGLPPEELRRRDTSLWGDLCDLLAPREVDLADLRTAPPDLRYRVAQGELLWCADGAARARFVADAVRDWLDFEPVVTYMRKRVVERIIGKSVDMADTAELGPVEERLGAIEEALARLRKLADLGREQFLAHTDNFALAQFHLRLAIEAALDIGRVLLGELAWRAPTSYRDVFVRLGEAAVLEREFAERGADLATFRNRMVHLYLRVTPQDVWDRLERDIAYLTDFAQRIAEYIATRKADE